MGPRPPGPGWSRGHRQEDAVCAEVQEGAQRRGKRRGIARVAAPSGQPSSLFLRPRPLPGLRPLLASVAGFGRRPQAAFGGHLVGATSEERLRNRRHLDPMLAHLRDPRRWSRISHTAALSRPPHLCADIALIGHASPFQAPPGSASFGAGIPKIGNMEFRLSFNKWRKLRPRESRHAQDYTGSQPGDPPTSDPLGKESRSMALAGGPGASHRSPWRPKGVGAWEVGSGVLCVK